MFEGSVTAGGALMTTTDVENFPGFPDGIMGPDLMDNLRNQAQRFGAELVADDVTAVQLDGDLKSVTTSDGTTHTAHTVILAMGSGYRKLNIPDEDRLSGHGVSWCATCDGFFFRDQNIVVVGGGDSAIEEATFLTRFASKVTLVHRRDELRASKIMQDRAFANDKIEFAWNSEVAELIGDDRLEGVVLRDTQTGETRQRGCHRPLHRHRPRPPLGAHQGSSRVGRRGLRARPARARRPRTWLESSPLATSSITPTGRPSLRPGPAVPPPSTPSATSPISSTQHRPDTHPSHRIT